MPPDNQHFKKGSAAYKCRCCGKLTRETGSCESNVQLCLACYDEAGLENEHSDGHHTTHVTGCPTCVAVNVNNTMHARADVIAVCRLMWRAEERFPHQYNDQLRKAVERMLELEALK